MCPPEKRPWKVQIKLPDALSWKQADHHPMPIRHFALWLEVYGKIPGFAAQHREQIFSVPGLAMIQHITSDHHILMFTKLNKPIRLNPMNFLFLLIQDG